MKNCYDCNHCEVCRWIDEFKNKDVCDFYETLEKHDEEVIKETVESIWGKPPYTELLDKIRAEIKSISPKTKPFLNSTDNYVKEDDVFQIIDKYKKEQE